MMTTQMEPKIAAKKMRQAINIPSLEDWLSVNCPDIQLPVTALQFTFGQSNPTYLLTGSDGSRYVLRKKPPMKLASKTIHWIEREYSVMKCLATKGVPVPQVYCLCTDESVLGTPFYLMEYLDGRIFEEGGMQGATAPDRQAMWKDVVRIIAKIHSLSVPSLDIESLNRAAGYYERQLGMFSGLTNVQASLKNPKTEKFVGAIPHADELISFFRKGHNRPAERISLVHGDFKIDNIVFHKTEPRVIGILDWEMSALGHPLSDLSRLLMQHLVPGLSAIEASNTGFLEGSIPGLPSIDQVLWWYKGYAGWDPRSDFGWAAAFDSFKSAVICQGVKARMMVGQTNSAFASHYVGLIKPFSESASRLIAEMQRMEQRRAEDSGEGVVRIQSML